MAKERDLRPGTPEAFRWGCKGTGHCTGGAHREGCALWDGSKGVPANIGGIVVGGVRVQKVPIGVSYTQTTLGALKEGELFVSEGDYKSICNNGSQVGFPFPINGFYTLHMKTGAKTSMPGMDVWKMEFVY